MHFEHLVLAPLAGARSVEAWSRDIQAKVAAVTGDDAAMAMMGVGAELADFRTLYEPRVRKLEEQYIGPLDASSRAVAEAERALEAARQRHRDLTGERWSAYRPDYERTLNAEPPASEEQSDEQPADPEHTDEVAESTEEVTS
jgi:hypothetical protein